MTTNSDLLTNINPVALGHVIDHERPILPYWKHIKNAMCSDSHSHPRGQFIFSSEGVTKVVTSAGVYLIPSSQAFWCPPNQKHQLFFLGEVNITNLFIDPFWAKKLPSEQQVLDVSPLVKELILKVIKIGTNYPSKGKERRLMEVVIDEISELIPSNLALPWSDHPKLQTIMQIILNAPSSNNTIEEWASLSHVSARTLSRLFNKELNMTFSKWRMQTRLFYALEKLHEGKSVTFIALELGYSTPSSFISAFKRSLGKSPLEYISIQKDLY
ncbi:AraC family transcriptional regulator [Colwellia echini]|uniref:Helix-turn-helix transcriptional regulator n=1 Tax=Colwellia echini TaxID=1982103 RepID=A0ABY3N048_9GAMM|nr:helix-turn-helix transcriptional regulator [Colwellia echini]TYK66820.1 helix-turn-helix transcriptional regulator [Colwellia echini]